MPTNNPSTKVASPTRKIAARAAFLILTISVTSRPTKTKGPSDCRPRGGKRVTSAMAGRTSTTGSPKGSLSLRETSS